MNAGEYLCWLSLIFIFLRLVGCIDWGWQWVLLPLLAYLLIIAIANIPKRWLK